MFLLACAAAQLINISAAAQSFAAEPVVRVKAKLTAFDGQVMSLESISREQPPPARAGAPPQPAKTSETLSVSVLPDTRYVRSDRTSFDVIKRGDYAGAAVSQGRDGRLKALDVYSYAQALRGTGEGRFAEGERLIVNGAVSAASTDSKQAGSLILHYRGAVLSGLGRGRTLCEGRASPPAYASALACEGDATIDVPPGTPVSALTVGDKSLLAPGRLVTVAMTKGNDGKNIAPGVIVEVPPSVPVEKPQSPQ